MLPGSVLAPNHTEPSVTISCATLPLRALSASEMSRSAEQVLLDRLELADATEANAVYSPSVANIHG